MNQPEIQNSKDINSNSFSDEKQKENLESFFGIQEPVAPENSKRLFLTKETQLQSLENKRTPQDNALLTGTLDKFKENDRPISVISDSAIDVAGRLKAPVKKLQRLASPEEELNFQFGIAPKPNSYNLNRSLVAEKSSFKKASELNQIPSTNKNMYCGK